MQYRTYFQVLIANRRGGGGGGGGRSIPCKGFSYYIPECNSDYYMPINNNIPAACMLSLTCRKPGTLLYRCVGFQFRTLHGRGNTSSHTLPLGGAYTTCPQYYYTTVSRQADLLPTLLHWDGAEERSGHS